MQLGCFTVNELYLLIKAVKTSLEQQYTLQTYPVRIENYNLGKVNRTNIVIERANNDVYGAAKTTS